MVGDIHHPDLLPDHGQGLIALALAAVLLIAIGPTGPASGCSSTDDEDSEEETTEETPTPPEGLQIEVISPPPGGEFDECGGICFEARLTLDGEPVEGAEGVIELELDGYIFEGVTDEDGRISKCPERVEIGQQEAAFTFRHRGEQVRSYTGFKVYPFGYDMGLIKEPVSMDELPWVPSFEKYAGNPVLLPGEDGEWDSGSVFHPSVVRAGGIYYLYYAGTPEVDFQIGAALSYDGYSWTKYSGNPVIQADFTPGSWKRYATNTPWVLYENGIFRMWYNGRAEIASNLAIGYAESTDGFRFTEYSGNPVLSGSEIPGDWEEGGVAHPAVIERAGLYEMWYTSGRLKIGYALSPDGIEWTKYCGNPVIEGNPSNWEGGKVKTTHVVFNGEYYETTYAGGGRSQYQLGWAASADGLRWIVHPEPVITTGYAGEWDSRGVMGATMLVEGDTYRVWYTGTSSTQGMIGVAEATQQGGGR